MQLITEHLTSIGGRRENEDALGEVTGKTFSLLAVADGLGGHGGGGFAARQCLETIVTAFADAPGLSDANFQALVEAADTAVAALRRERREHSSSMRTTVALLAICQGSARWAHVGDSRVYWFRQNVLMERTRDHSISELISGLADRSSVAPPDETDRNRLLRAVGAGTGCNVEVGGTVVSLQVGDAFLLCTDGVWSMVSDMEITNCLCKAATPLDWCIALEQRLKECLRCVPAKEQDNYSMISGMVVS
jgi:serine/threonine protein phosphatase PrpC